jgi:threonine/homoserine/homoserine lactone efflux protein
MQVNIPAFMGVALFILVTRGPDTALVTWMSGYALMAAEAGGLLARPRVKAALDRITGFVLVALGLRLATESR